ncbi:MAG: GMC family oxidoreductase [Saprospiraceae bacterium]
MTDYDMIIIGSGAGGGTLAYGLADTGKKILILERGGYLPREVRNWDPNYIFTEQGYQTREEWLDPDDRAYRPMAFYHVGGNTKVFGAVLQRNRPEDFTEMRHEAGISPGWVVRHDEFEPYYMMAEHLYTIHGLAGEDPTEGPRSGPYPFDPFPHEPRIQEVADQLEARGFTPLHSTLALNRDVHHPERRPCIACRTCDPYPCMLHAKSDAEVVAVRPALAHPNVDLWTGCHVDRLEEKNGVVSKVHFTREGEQRTLSADMVVVSCGAVNTAALLLRSGIANSSGRVGHNLIKHNQSGITAIGKTPNPTIFQKTLGFHDWYHRSPEHDYPLGAIQLTGKAPWQRLQADAKGDVPLTMLQHMAAHAVDFWFTSEDLPKARNKVELKNGQIKFNYKPNNRKSHFQMMELFQRHLRKLDFYQFMPTTMELPIMWHQAGTCAFGDDPRTSVLDRNCKAHDLDNLYVVDSSFQPTMGAVNPTLTIAANALRVADHLRERWGGGSKD